MDGGVTGDHDSEMHVMIKPGIEGIVCLAEKIIDSKQSVVKP